MLSSREAGKIGNAPENCAADNYFHLYNSGCVLSNGSALFSREEVLRDKKPPELTDRTQTAG